MQYDEFIDQLKSKDKGYRYPSWAFVARCFDNERDRYMGTVDAAEDLDSAIVAIRDHPDRFTSQAWAELAKAECWPLAAMVPDEKFVFTSEAGGVLVGDVAGTCGMVVPNGYGDGATEVLVYTDPKRVNLHQLEFWDVLEGKWRLYEYDCAELAPATKDTFVLSGRTMVYYGEGTVVFVAIAPISN